MKCGIMFCSFVYSETGCNVHGEGRRRGRTDIGKVESSKSVFPRQNQNFRQHGFSVETSRPAETGGPQDCRITSEIVNRVFG